MSKCIVSNILSLSKSIVLDICKTTRPTLQHRIPLMTPPSPNLKNMKRNTKNIIKKYTSTVVTFDYSLVRNIAVGDKFS